MSESVTFEFKYKVGDLVCHVGAAHASRLVEPVWKKQEPKAWTMPGAWYVLERVPQQCYGGIQLWYTCRPINGKQSYFDAGHELVKFTEVELMPFVDALKARDEAPPA